MSVRIKLGKQPDMPEGGEGPHRPELRIWTDVDSDLGHHISVSVSALWGQPQRFFDLKLPEAEQFATAILEAVATALLSRPETLKALRAAMRLRAGRPGENHDVIAKHPGDKLTLAYRRYRPVAPREKAR